MGDELFRSLEWRCIGPHRGGRVVAVAGHPTRAGHLLLRRLRGRCLEDDRRRRTTGRTSPMASSRTAAVGAIAVAHSDPNVLYAGTGETTIRGNVSHGDGVYKSTDGGQSWRNVGLRGHAPHRRHRHPPHQSRYRLRRGAGPRLGAERGARRLPLARRRQDLAADALQERARRGRRSGAGPAQPAHPLRHDLAGAALAARARQRRRRTAASSARTDGGDTWTRSRATRGCPTGAAAARSASPSRRRRPGRVWALVEAEDGARLPLGRLAARPGSALNSEMRPAPAPLVLHAHLRRPAGRRHRLGAQLRVLEVDRRRQDLQRAFPRRTATTTISGSTRTTPAA